MKCGETECEFTDNVDSHSIILEIFIDPNYPERMNKPEAKGLRHICFTVDDIDKITERIDCEKIRTDWFGRRCAFNKDSDGQPIELKEKK